MCRLLSSCNLALLPFSLWLLSILTFFTTYFVAVYRKDVYPYFPVVGLTYDRAPEKNIFSQLFNICSFLALITFGVRYFQLRHDADWNESDKPFVLKLNKISLSAGIGATAGASMVANFTIKESEMVNTAGVMMVFVFGVLYCSLQTLISFNMKKCGMNTKCLFSVRMCISVLSLILLVVHFVLKDIANKQWNKAHPNNNTHSEEFWKPGDKGYWQHATSALSEWLLMVVFMVFLATFFGEFRTFRIRLMLSRYNDNPIPLSISDDDHPVRAPLLL